MKYGSGAGLKRFLAMLFFRACHSIAASPIFFRAVNLSWYVHMFMSFVFLAHGKIRSRDFFLGIRRDTFYFGGSVLLYGS